MKKNIKLPFTDELKGGNKKSFKILNEEQLVNKLKKDVSMLNIIKKFIHINNTNKVRSTNIRLFTRSVASKNEKKKRGKKENEHTG